MNLVPTDAQTTGVLSGLAQLADQLTEHASGWRLRVCWEDSSVRLTLGSHQWTSSSMFTLLMHAELRQLTGAAWPTMCSTLLAIEIRLRLRGCVVVFEFSRDRSANSLEVHVSVNHVGVCPSCLLTDAITRDRRPDAGLRCAHRDFLEEVRP
jgi:hypothetical protein